MINAHFLPRTFLSGFLNNSRKIHQLNTKYRNWKEKDVEQVAYKPDFYSFQDEEGNRYDEIENPIFSDIEAPYAEIISKIESSEELTEKEIEDLFVFISFLLYRIPRMKEYYVKMMTEAPMINLRSMARRAPELLKGMYEDIKDGLPDETNWEKFLEYMREYDPNDVTWDHNKPTQEYVIFMCEIAIKNYNLLRRLNYEFIIAGEGEEFITGDFPYFINSKIKEKGLLTGDTYIPLSKKVCLKLSPDNQLDTLTTDEINQGIINASEIYIYSSSIKDLTKFLDERIETMRSKIEYFEVEDGIVIKHTQS